METVEVEVKVAAAKVVEVEKMAGVRVAVGAKEVADAMVGVEEMEAEMVVKVEAAAEMVAGEDKEETKVAHMEGAVEEDLEAAKEAEVATVVLREEEVGDNKG